MVDLFFLLLTNLKEKQLVAFVACLEVRKEGEVREDQGDYSNDGDEHEWYGDHKKKAPGLPEA